MGGTQLASVERAARSLIEAEPYRESGYIAADGGAGAAGQRGRGAAGVRPAADAAARRARDDALGRGDRRPRAAAAPGSRAAAGAEPASADASRRDRAAGRAARRAPRPRWSGASGSWPSSSELWLSGDASRRRRRRDRAGSCCWPATRGSARRGLAAELARRAHEEGACVLAGRAPRGGAGPLPAVPRGAAPLLAQRPDLRELAGAVARVRRRAGPAGPRAAPPAPPSCRRPSPAEPETERYRLFEAVVGLLSSISARAPMLLVLDDLHWADRPDAAAAAPPGAGAATRRGC